MSLNPPVDIALIGTGNRATTQYAPLFEFLRPWIRLVAVCDPVKENADRMADRLNVDAFYSVRELVQARPMEAALIIAPIETHYPISCFLMSHGIHCHVETSMTNLLAQGQAMVETAKQNNVILRIAENFFRFPFDRIAKKIVETGFIGDVMRLNCFHDHTGYHNNSRWIHFFGEHPESVQTIRHTMPVAPHYSMAHRFHTTEDYRSHYFTFPGNKLVIDSAANIKGLLGRYPRPGYTEIDGQRGTIVRAATNVTDPKRGWTGDAEVRYCSDEVLNTQAIADQIYPIEHVTEEGWWIRTHVDLPDGRVEYENPYRVSAEAAKHATRDYYTASIIDHIVDFASAVRSVKPSEYTDDDALMAMMMEVATRESILRDGQRVSLPLTGELLESEALVRNQLMEKHSVDPMDIEGMLEMALPRP